MVHKDGVRPLLLGKVDTGRGLDCSKAKGEKRRVELYKFDDV